MIKVGVDIGSTHTDAVAVEGKTLLYAVKVNTTPDLTTGLENAINKIIQLLRERKNEIGALMVGTTHGLNAIHQAKGLARVAVIRIGLPAGEGVPPLTEWNERLKKYATNIYMVKGGHEYTGEEIVPLDEEKLRQIAEEIKGKVDAVTITSIFSIVNPEHEKRAEEILRSKGINVPITLSHKIGGIGLIERENSAILNSMILFVFRNLIQRLKTLMEKLGIEGVKLYFAQNDGTIAGEEFIKDFPIFTVAGPVSNSIRGAHILTGIKDAIVLDIGGTTTNVGVLHDGFPRESSTAVEITGIRTNFRMPDIFTMALGGGTIIDVENDKIGPESVGYNLEKDGISWGGNVLTATDVAMYVKGFRIEGSSPELVKNKFNGEKLKRIYEEMKEMWYNAIDMMKTTKEDVIVIVVGGGSIMFPSGINGTSQIIRPENAQYANAIGATLTKIGATIERTISYETKDRSSALSELIDDAKKLVVQAGARQDSIEIREIEEIPLPYLPGNSVKVTVKVVGELGQR